MPIALLLTSMMTPLSGLTAAFDRWNAVLRLETLVIDRARGAFLVNWFGVRLPRSDGRLRVAIDNIEALGEQYRMARSRSMGGQTGPNLLEPVAGMAGMVAGMAISPSAGFMYMYAALRSSLGWILSSVLTISHGPLMAVMVTGLGTAAAVILFPFVLIGGFIAAMIGSAGNSTMVLAYEALGDATRMVQALTRFINLLTGPRENIRNPLLRQLLLLFDRVAALFAQLIGAFAWVVTRIGSRILSIAMQLRAMRTLGSFTMALAADLLRGTFDVLLSVLRSEEGQRASPWEVLMAMFDHAIEVGRRMVEGAGEALARMSLLMAEGFAAITARTRSAIDLSTSRATQLIGDIPLIRELRAAAAMVKVVRSIFAGAGGGAAAAPTSSPSGASAAITGALATSGSLSSLLAPPPTPSMTAASSMVARVRASGRPVGNPWGADFTPAMAAPFELDPATQALAQQLIEPPASVFAGERAALSRELGGRTPDQALETLRVDELRYRDLLYGIVGQVMPAQARARIPDLLDAFDALDHHLYGRPEAEGPNDFPVLNLPDNGRLRPVVKRLTVRSAGGDSVSLGNIATDLARLLREQAYLAPAAG